jgi:hypothetical protein
MFERTQSSLKNKARIFSSYLFALYTGSRAITCVNVQLRDIKLLLKENKTIIITINQQITKGCSIRWSVKKQDIMCFVFWLNQHLMKDFNLVLNNYDSWELNEEQLNTFLWRNNSNRKLTTSVMSNALTRFTKLNGYGKIENLSSH